MPRVVPATQRKRVFYLLIGQFLPVHFRETLHDHDAENPMTFDYKLREGVATTTNALKLLEIVGLGNDPD